MAIASATSFCPDEGARDLKRALKLAQRAVELSPNEGIYWNTLGVAQYRANDLAAALTSLEKSMELQDGGDSHDFFFVAMIHARRADPNAHQWLTKTIDWMQQNAPNDKQLILFRNEAEQLIGS